MMKRNLAAALVAGVTFAAASSAAAGEFDGALSALAEEKLRAIASDPAVVEAVKAQNAEHAALAQGDIDRMDKDWRAQVGQSPAPLIDKVSAKPVSAHLVGVRDGSEGLFTEIFAMDDKGLNVGVSDVTSDYWQGDEAKWQKTYQAGPDAVHISEVELDDSTQTFQSQVSLPVIDPATGEPIGAITFGVNVEFL